MPEISVIIPSYNTPEKYLKSLYGSILAQTLQDFEVILVDDCSKHDYYDIIKDSRFRVVRMSRNGGPAKCRNYGAGLAKSQKLFFTDSDCTLTPGTLLEASKGLDRDDIIMGDTVTAVKTRFGRAVAYLGFPGGGIIGFENVWHVDENGYTDSISSCNLAVNRNFFDASGKFDTSFPVAGGEDTYFAKKIVAQGGKIKYNKKQVVHHVERGSYSGFKKWQIVRGRGNYHIKKNLGSVDSFYRLRLWSFTNSLIKSGIYFPVVGYLILISYIYQKKGYNIEANNVEGKVAKSR